MKYITILTCVVLAGCQADSDATIKRRGEARQAVFVQCMELAAKSARQGDDDVSDIVTACSSASYYQTNYVQ